MVRESSVSFFSFLLHGALAASAGERQVDMNVISVFGSSVADGWFCSGNCSGHAYNASATPGGCYQSRLREYQAAYRGRSIFNSAHGGDTTTKLLDRFDQFLSTKAGFAFIGLSLANEGLRSCWTRWCHQRVFDHYETGMRKLVAEIRDAGAIPVVGSCYPNSDYTEEEYEFIKRMNMLTAQWDLATPQINFLGAIDDGHGRWVSGHSANEGHPNDKGSTEMYYAFVPSMFDAILAGKPAVPSRGNSSQFLTLQAGTATESVVFNPKSEETIHSFTFSFDFRCNECDGDISKVLGHAPTPVPPAEFSADADVHLLSINTRSGGLQYVSPAHTSSASSSKVNDGGWHSVTLTHYYANGTIALYVDGTLTSQDSFKVNAKSFALSPKSAVDFRDLLIYRSGLNEKEREFNLNNRTHVFHASLEVYAPFDAGEPLNNRAQSLSHIVLDRAGADPIHELFM